MSRALPRGPLLAFTLLRSLVLPASLLRSTMKAIELEIDATRAKLKAAEEGTGPAENVERFTRKLRTLEAEQARFVGMKPGDYPEPVKERSGSSSVLDQPAESGPVLPPVMRDVVVTVDGPFGDGDDGILKNGKRYRLDICLVYRREYFGLIGDYYVHVVSAR